MTKWLMSTPQGDSKYHCVPIDGPKPIWIPQLARVDKETSSPRIYENDGARPFNWTKYCLEYYQIFA